MKHETIILIPFCKQMPIYIYVYIIIYNNIYVYIYIYIYKYIGSLQVDFQYVEAERNKYLKRKKGRNYIFPTSLFRESLHSSLSY